MSDWRTLPIWLRAVEHVVSTAEISAADRTEAIDILSGAQRKLDQARGFVSGAECVMETAANDLPFVAQAALARTLQDTKQRHFDRVAGEAARALAICGRKRRRRPLGSKKSEDADILLAMEAWRLKRDGNPAPILSAIRRASERGDLSQTTTEQGHRLRIKRALEHYEPVFDHWLAEEEAA